MVWDLRKGFPNLSAAKTLVVDTETNGVQWKRCHVVGYVLTWGPSPDETGYWPVRHEGGGNVKDPEAVERWVRDQMKRQDVTKVGHFLKFDMHMMLNHQITLEGPLSCTMVTAALLDEGAGRYGLDAVAQRIKGVPLKKGEDLYKEIYEKFKDEGCKPGRDAMAMFYKMPGDNFNVVDYSAGDGTTTWHVHQWQMQQVVEEELQRVYDVECRNLRVLLMMERRGVRVDEERLLGLEKYMNKRVAEIRKSLPKDFNPRSSTDMKKLMAKHESKWMMTKAGNPSFTEKWLETVPEGRNIIMLRKATNMLNSFILPLKEEHIFNGRVHTTFNQLKMDDYGTVTGRLSSSDPNMQQVPKRDKLLAPLFRSVFRCDPGYVWSANDYSQQEYRVFAHYTQNEMLIKGYSSNPPVDIHQVVADLCGVGRDPTAKRINLGKLYGMGLPKLALSLDISLEEAQRIDRKYKQMIPESKDFLKYCERKAKNNGYVKSLLGRRRRFPDPSFAHKAGNAVIAMGSADITKLKMAEIDEFFAQAGEGQMLLQVHDELDWQIPDTKDGKKLDAKASKIMQSFTKDDKIELSLPLTTDAHHGDDWSEATFKKKFEGFK
jgi:DNA polymerase-1